MKHSKSLFAFAVCALLFASCQKDTETQQAVSSQSTDDLAVDVTQHVFVLSNQAAGNEVMMYSKAADGTLTYMNSYPTGGMGTGAGLGSQGSIIIQREKKLLLAVNAGDNTITCMQITDNGLKVLSTVWSGGEMPISATNYKNVIYVLNAGGWGNISGFMLNARGMLKPIPKSTKALSSNQAGGAEIAFVQGGKVLVVTEKATNSITSYSMNDDYTPGMMYSTPSANATPFGFAVGKNNLIYVSEAAGGAPNASTLSSYHVSQNGMVKLVSGPVTAGQTAACWVVMGRNDRFAYATNTGSNNISSFKVTPFGTLGVSQAEASASGMSPIDAAVNSNGKYLYVLSSASHDIGVFSVADNGMITNMQYVSDLPAGAIGMATD